MGFKLEHKTFNQGIILTQFLKKNNIYISLVSTTRWTKQILRREAAPAFVNDSLLADACNRLLVSSCDGWKMRRRHVFLFA